MSPTDRRSFLTWSAGALAAGTAATLAPGSPLAVPAAAAGGPGPSPAPDGRILPAWGGEPVFEDTFDGADLNRDNWAVGDCTDRGDYCLGYLAYDWGVPTLENVYVTDGTLRVRMNRLSADQRGDYNGRACEWATGHLSTSQAGRPFTQEYGRWEIRAKFPASPGISAGMWGGFCLRAVPVNGAPAPSGEIGIAEVYGSKSPTAKETGFDPANRSESIVHFSQSDRSTAVRAWSPEHQDLENDWHVWACERTPEGIAFDFDGRRLATCTRKGNEAGFDAGFPAGTQLGIRLSFQAGNPYWGRPDDKTRESGEIIVDYVRAWKYTGC